MKLNGLFLFTAILWLLSCNSQNASQITNGNLNGRNNSIIIGDTVGEMSNSIMVIYQDKKNVYWFGSKGQGVYRYDGKVILHYTKKDGLISNEIWGIQEDKSGNIFFDTQEGVSRFDGQSFSTLQVSDSSSNWKGIGTDELWFKGNWNKNGAYSYDGKTLHQHSFPKNEIAESMRGNFPNTTWSPYGLYSIFKDKKGNIWFGTSNTGIYRYNIYDNTNSPAWMYEDELTNVPGGGSFGIRSMFEDKDGAFWFCNTNYRYEISEDDSSSKDIRYIQYNKENGIDHVMSTKGKDMIYFLSITEDNNKELWMVTYDKGVWHYDWKNMKQYILKDGSRNITLYSIYKDNNGVLWIGTHDTGAFRYNGTLFEKFTLKKR